MAEQNAKKKLSDRMGFGKYKDQTLRWVIEHDSDYMNWAVETIDWFKLDKDASDYLEQNSDFEAFADESWHPGHPSNHGDK